MKTKLFTIGAVLLSLAALAGLGACKSESNEEPYRECVKDSDCGPGYVCKFQECKRAIPEDGEAPDGDDNPDGDQDIPNPDGDTPIEDGDTTEPVEDGDTETDQDSDEEWDGVCDENHIDPRCGDFFSELFCRGNTVRHSVIECRRDAESEYLARCNLTCSYSDCGYVTNDSYLRPCTQGCVSNPNPEKNDYCAEDVIPEDGDVPDGDIEADDDPDGDIDIPNHQELYPCQTTADCVLGLKCRVDWDADGRYCARDDGSCVFHVGIPDGQPALLYSQGDRVCLGNAHKRCSSGSWVNLTTCPGDECEDGIIREAQTCDGGVEGRTATCVPSPRVSYPCPGYLQCLTDTNYCRSNCTQTPHCRTGYICNPQNTCVCDGGPHCQ